VVVDVLILNFNTRLNKQQINSCNVPWIIKKNSVGQQKKNNRFKTMANSVSPILNIKIIYIYIYIYI